MGIERTLRNVIVRTPLADSRLVGLVVVRDDMPSVVAQRDALARIGRKGQAREIFEMMLKSRNPLGLLSEDTHPVTGEMWGNFPQTYSMVGLINAAVRLSAPWDSVI